jgi:hypothetical protein
VDPFAADKPTLHHHAAQRRAARREALGRPPGAAQGVPELQDERVPDAAQRLAPQRIYDAIGANVGRARLVNDGNGVEGAIGGPPFPMPTSGVEVIWNHLLRYRGDAVRRWVMQATPTRGGQYTPVQFDEETYVLYSAPSMTPAALSNRILYFKQTVTAPARLAGGILLVHETTRPGEEAARRLALQPRAAPRAAGAPGRLRQPGHRRRQHAHQRPARHVQRRARPLRVEARRQARALRALQQLQAAGPGVKYRDIVTPLHLNPDHLRYELHRVWVVEATLRPGARHIYKRRVFYVDEDSWQILVVDQYDNRDQLWRVSEGHPISFYNVPTLWTAAEAHIDLQAGRYVVMGLFSESRVHDFTVKLTDAQFTPDALRQEGVR